MKKKKTNEFELRHAKKPNNRVKEEAKIFLRTTDHPEPKVSVEIQTLSSLWSKKRLRERASKRGILSLSLQI